MCAHLGWACRPSHPPWFSAGPHLGSQASWGPLKPQRLGDYAAPSRFRRCFPSLFPTGSRTALRRFFTLRSGLEHLCVRRLRLPRPSPSLVFLVPERELSGPTLVQKLMSLNWIQSLINNTRSQGWLVKPLSFNFPFISQDWEGAK